MNALTTSLLAPTKDPTGLVWPPTLPIELALKTATPEQLRVEYGYDRAAWDALPQNPNFLRDLTAACEMVRQEGMTFKLKAKLIAEENLKEVFKMVRETHGAVPPTVKAKLIELTARWAEYDPRTWSDDARGGGGMSQALNIQINLGSDY
jgi:hypothetical protein